VKPALEVQVVMLAVSELLVPRDLKALQPPESLAQLVYQEKRESKVLKVQKKLVLQVPQVIQV